MGAAYSTVGYLASRGAQSSAKKSKTEAERQSLQRKMADTQALLDEGYAQGGAEGQIKISVDILSVIAPSGEVIIPKITEQPKSVNWRTVRIGAVTSILGIGQMVGGIIVGTTTSVSGIGFYAAATTFVNGLTFSAIGVGDIVNGLTGGDSVLRDFIKGYYSPDLSTAVNPF